MARDPSLPVTWTEKIVTHSAPTMLAGLGAVGCGFLLSNSKVDSAPLTVLVVGLIVSGLVLAGTSIIIRYRQTRWAELESRLLTGAVLALGGLAALVGYWAMYESWDTARLVMSLLVAIALAGGVLVMLPQGWRRAIVSLLVIVHFGGILAAVTSPPPPNGSPPWVTGQLWARFYRPYLELIYETNAYHFYSPDPGPAYILWFYIQYADGTTYKLEVPRQDAFTTRLEFQRRLAMADRASTADGTVPDLEMINNRRTAGLLHNPPIILHPELVPTAQFRRPTTHGLRLLSSYVRHISETYQSQEDPPAPVKRVKVYCMIHHIITAQQLELGWEANDPATFAPMYFGTWDSQGNLQDSQDPLLYWMIPIYRQRKADVPADGHVPRFEETELVNLLETHAQFTK
jgi:hypothetical protein